jgi:DnaJ-class molecular chaperone
MAETRSVFRLVRGPWWKTCAACRGRGRRLFWQWWTRCEVCHGQQGRWMRPGRAKRAPDAPEHGGE